MMRRALSKRVLITAIFFVIAGLAVYFWQLSSIPASTGELTFRVMENDNVASIARRLKEQGIIKHPAYYYLSYFAFGPGTLPSPGGYRLSAGMSSRQILQALQGPAWAKYVTLTPGLEKDQIGAIMAKALGWDDIDREYFARTYAGMQWQAYQEGIEGVFTRQYEWSEKKGETFLTLSALYYDLQYDFFKNMYDAGDYEIPVVSSRAQVAGILIDEFTKKHGIDAAALLSYLDKTAMDNVNLLITKEMMLLPDIVAIPPKDVDIKKIGARTYLRFSTSYWNAGKGPLEFIADPSTSGVEGDISRKIFQRIYNLDGGYVERLSGTFLWHSPHHHYHYSDFAVYNLEPVDVGGAPFEEKLSYKSTFCIRDYNPIDLTFPGARKAPSYTVCGKERQGISAGWADSYYFSYVDQKFDITNFPSGTYRLSIIINPKDRFEEITKNNNIGEALLSIDVLNNKVKVLEEKNYGIKD